MTPQPLITVHDVEASSRWYQSVLGLRSGHGGEEYEQLLDCETLVLQLHHWDAHEHPHLGDREAQSRGNGVVLWFETQEISQAYDRAIAAHATVLEPLDINRNANHREFWLRDPDGYVIVVAGRRCDLG